MLDDSTGLILKALRFSAEKHNDQRRKDAKASPYINHLIGVAETLWSIGGVRDVNLLTAAILHDTIEDTNTTPEELKTEFGEEILSLVLEVTDDKSLPKQTRKQLQIEHANHKSEKAKMLKIADKLSNIQDIVKSPPSNWTLERKREYLLWTEKVMAGLRGVNPNLESQYDALLAEGKRSLRME